MRRTRRATLLCLTSTAFAMVAAPPASAQTTTAPAGRASAPTSRPDASWHERERGILENHVQLTFADRFYKAGEAYFSPDGRQVIFQAVETPSAGEAPAEFYGMYLADVAHDALGGIRGLDDIRRISPPGSANTCGWFDPIDRDIVYFGSTVTSPIGSEPPGYNRLTGRYKWMFPPAMRIYRCELSGGVGTAAAMTLIAGSGRAYCAEGGVSPDGRWMVYCSLDSGDGDLFVVDLQTRESVQIVAGPGYDGGPFFSPDGRRICFRSDRRNDHHLQLFVADLAFDDTGAIVGIEREYQLTDNAHVNWAPFWHPGARHLVYATSQVGHHNYEVFMVDADPGDLPGSSGSIRYGTHGRRITHAERADVLPVFNRDGTRMLWTSQRGSDERSQLWVADFVMDLDAAPAPSSGSGRPDRGRSDRERGGH